MSIYIDRSIGFNLSKQNILIVRTAKYQEQASEVIFSKCAMATEVQV